MGRVWYTTRESVQDAFDVKEAAHRSMQIDAAIASASDDIDGWLNRHKHGLAPHDATRYFSWPGRDGGGATRLWLDENELVSVTSFTAGGTAIASGDYFLEPVNSGPPYTYIELDLDSQASFSNSGTSQRALAIVGVWGINNDQKVAGTLTEALDASETAVDVSDGTLVGVGSVLTVESERMLVTGRSTLTTGQTLASDMTALNSDRTVDVASGAALKVGETILIDSERMKVVDIVGNNATVIRAYDGSVLAVHSTGATVYAYRTLTVERGALGTTAATHADATAITTWDVPALVGDLCKAAAIVRLEQEWSAYGARVYSDEAERDSSGTEVVAGRGLTDLRKACARRYKRKFRKRAI
jgi:hypothetical protein